MNTSEVTKGMKCKKLVIETDGTSGRTQILIDGKQLGFVDSINFNANLSKHEVDVVIMQYQNQNEPFKGKRLFLKLDFEKKEIVEIDTEDVPSQREGA